MKIQRADTALLIVDMQNGFLQEQGSMAGLGLPYQQLREAIPGCQALITAARGAGVPVIFTRYVFHGNYEDAGVMATHRIPAIVTNRALSAGSWDADIVDDLHPADTDVVIDKSRPSAFYGTRLDPVLSGLGVRSLVLAGVTTNICVETTARDAGQRDYVVHVAADATAEFEQERHAQALNTIDFFFGWVTKVADIEQAWAQPAPK